MATQDELIQAELDWTIDELEAKQNDDSEQVETQTVEQTTEEVKEEVEEPKEETPKDTTTNKQSSVIKLLKQRNEAKAKVEELEAKLKENAELEARIKELEEGIASQELEREAQKEKEAFYTQYPNAKWHEEGIEKLRAEKDLSYSEAFQLYAAQNDPTLLMDEQYRNKKTSWATLTGVAKVNTQVKDPKEVSDFSEMSDDDFLAWSDWMAQKERSAAGYVK
jgi:hypothetical protein